MNDPKNVRQSVSEAYAKAVSKSDNQNKPIIQSACCQPSGTSSCCTPLSPVTPEMPQSSCCCQPDPKGVAAESAGYASEELGQLPVDAVENSFGCGNPLAYTDVLPGQTVLDLGSGAGIDLLLAAKKVGPKGKVIGIDMTDAMIEKARANIQKQEAKNIEVRKGIIEKLPVDDNSVDWVISNCVINLSPEKERVFKEIERVLKSNGRISISDIVVQNLPPWVREHQGLYCACVSGAITESAYVKGLQEAGLIDVDVSERYFYDAKQLAGIIRSDQLLNNSINDKLDEVINELAGKVWSAKFMGKKK